MALDVETLGAALAAMNSALSGAGALKGEEGKSAYEVALNNGFDGSEEEWLESLKATGDNNVIESISVDGNTVLPDANKNVNLDLSDYAKKDEVEDLTHEHTNKNIIDTITSEKISEWDKAEENVQSNWDEVDETSNTYIINKPEFEELTEDDILAMLGLSDEELAGLASVIADAEVRIDKTYSSSKIYTELQNMLAESKNYTLLEVGKASGTSYKVVASIDEMIDTKYIYLLPIGSTYDLYIYEEESSEAVRIGNTSVELYDYYTKFECDDKYVLQTAFTLLNSSIGDVANLKTSSKDIVDSINEVKDEVNEVKELIDAIDFPVDSEFNADSENAIANKVVTEKFEEVDDALDKKAEIDDSGEPAENTVWSSKKTSDEIDALISDTNLTSTTSTLSASKVKNAVTYNFDTQAGSAKYVKFKLNITTVSVVDNYGGKIEILGANNSSSNPNYKTAKVVRLSYGDWNSHDATQVPSTVHTKIGELYYYSTDEYYYLKLYNYAAFTMTGLATAPEMVTSLPVDVSELTLIPESKFTTMSDLATQTANRQVKTFDNTNSTTEKWYKICSALTTGVGCNIKFTASRADSTATVQYFSALFRDNRYRYTSSYISRERTVYESMLIAEYSAYIIADANNDIWVHVPSYGKAIIEIDTRAITIDGTAGTPVKDYVYSSFEHQYDGKINDSSTNTTSTWSSSKIASELGTVQKDSNWKIEVRPKVIDVFFTKTFRDGEISFSTSGVFTLSTSVPDLIKQYVSTYNQEHLISVNIYPSYASPLIQIHQVYSGDNTSLMARYVSSGTYERAFVTTVHWKIFL